MSRSMNNYSYDRRKTAVGPRVVQAAMSEQKFWAIIEPFGWGTRSTDYKRIMRSLMGQLSPDEADELRAIFSKLQQTLNQEIEEYERQTDQNIGLGDDSFDDLTSHIIGMGRRVYEETLRNPQLAFDRAKKHDYEESFSYALPHKSSYEDLKIDRYLTRAKRALLAYKMVLAADEEYIPWLPKIQQDLRTLILSLDGFVKEQDVHAFLAEEAELRRAAENVEKALARLAVGWNYGDGSIEDAVALAKNKWAIWNLLTDLRDYMV